MSPRWIITARFILMYKTHSETTRSQLSFVFCFFSLSIHFTGRLSYIVRRSASTGMNYTLCWFCRQSKSNLTAVPSEARLQMMKEKSWSNIKIKWWLMHTESFWSAQIRRCSDGSDSFLERRRRERESTVLLLTMKGPPVGNKRTDSSFGQS